MTRERWWGSLIIAGWLVAGVGWMPFAAMSVFLPPISILYWTVVGLPLYLATWRWLRPGLTRMERSILVAGGLGWLLIDLSVAALFLKLPWPPTLREAVTLTWLYFPPFSALLFGATVLTRRRRLPAQ
ncbi:MAG TPA: hypothetical protein VHR41_01635 [Gemmatimonadales bacterium]|nr:hypothetical protein [Gemmatimonadales bacterium]